VPVRRGWDRVNDGQLQLDDMILGRVRWREWVLGTCRKEKAGDADALKTVARWRTRGNKETRTLIREFYAGKHPRRGRGTPKGTLTHKGEWALEIDSRVRAYEEVEGTVKAAMYG
jgi:hypothetical protein